MPAAPGPVVNAMSIDVEDYFHANAIQPFAPRERWPSLESRVEANTDRYLELFERVGITATFFVLGWVADRCPALVRRIAQAGHEVASHGYWHQLVYDLSPEAFDEDVRRARGQLQELSGGAVVGYRAPSYSITTRSLWALDVLRDAGYQYDASIFPIHHDRYGIPGAPRHPHRLTGAGAPLVEVPPSTVRLGRTNLPIAGGGYFRLLPFAWTRWGIRRVNRVERRPVIFYLHPWEIDPGQPRFPVGRATRFRHYHNLGRTMERLERLLAEFRFAPIATVLDTVTLDA